MQGLPLRFFAEMSINCSRIARNSAEYGAAIFIEEGELLVKDTVICVNIAHDSQTEVQIIIGLRHEK